MRTKTIKCLKCQMTILSDLKSYEIHEAQYHAMLKYVKIVPVRTTDRSTTQIVVDVENKMKAFIIGNDLPLHVCKRPCMECLNKSLDSLIQSQEELQ